MRASWKFAEIHVAPEHRATGARARDTEHGGDMPSKFDVALRPSILTTEAAASLLCAVAWLNVHARNSSMHTVLTSLMWAQFIAWMYRGWARGMLTSTPAQMVRRLQAEGTMYYYKLEPLVIISTWLTVDLLKFA